MQIFRVISSFSNIMTRIICYLGYLLLLFVWMIRKGGTYE